MILCDPTPPQRYCGGSITFGCSITHPPVIKPPTLPVPPPPLFPRLAAQTPKDREEASTQRDAAQPVPSFTGERWNCEGGKDGGGERRSAKNDVADGRAGNSPELRAGGGQASEKGQPESACGGGTAGARHARCYPSPKPLPPPTLPLLFFPHSPNAKRKRVDRARRRLATPAAAAAAAAVAAGFLCGGEGAGGEDGVGRKGKQCINLMFHCPEVYTDNGASRALGCVREVTARYTIAANARSNKRKPLSHRDTHWN